MFAATIAFINGGEPMPWAPGIPIWFSLAFIGTTVAVATVASLVSTRCDGAEDDREAAPHRAGPMTPGSRPLSPPSC